MRKQKKYKRLSFEKRVKLFAEIRTRKCSAVKCSRVLKVSKIQNHLVISERFAFAGTSPPCKDSKICPINGPGMLCYKTNCLNYEERICEKLLKFPLVCNGCENNKICKDRKRYYNCEESHAEAISLRSSSRAMDYETKEIELINSLISPIIQNRNSLHHAMEASKGETDKSERTVRRYIYKGVLDVKCSDLPMWNAFQRMKTSDYRPTRQKIQNIDIYAARMYTDYLRFVEQNPGKRVVQIDSVIGKTTDAKALMTIHHVETGFMFGYMIKKGEPYFSTQQTSEFARAIGAGYILQNIFADSYRQRF